MKVVFGVVLGAAGALAMMRWLEPLRLVMDGDQDSILDERIGR